MASSNDNILPMLTERQSLDKQAKELKAKIAKLDETLRPMLSESGPVVHNKTVFSVTMSKGRRTLDKNSLVAAGIDLTPHYKIGAPSSRFTMAPIDEGDFDAE